MLVGVEMCDPDTTQPVAHQTQNRTLKMENKRNHFKVGHL